MAPYVINHPAPTLTGTISGSKPFDLHDTRGRPLYGPISPPVSFITYTTEIYTLNHTEWTIYQHSGFCAMPPPFIAQFTDATPYCHKVNSPSPGAEKNGMLYGVVTAFLLVLVGLLTVIIWWPEGNCTSWRSRGGGGRGAKGWVRARGLRDGAQGNGNGNGNVPLAVRNLVQVGGPRGCVWGDGARVLMVQPQGPQQRGQSVDNVERGSMGGSGCGDGNNGNGGEGPVTPPPVYSQLHWSSG